MVKVYLLLGLSFSIEACCSNSEKNKQDLDKLTKKNVLATLSKVNDKWQTEHKVIHQKAFWRNATYHIGNLAAHQLTKIEQSLNHTIKWAENNQWSGA